MYIPKDYKPRAKCKKPNKYLMFLLVVSFTYLLMLFGAVS